MHIPFQVILQLSEALPSSGRAFSRITANRQGGCPLRGTVILDKNIESEKMVALHKKREGIFEILYVFFNGAAFPDGASPRNALADTIQKEFRLGDAPHASES